MSRNPLSEKQAHAFLLSFIQEDVQEAWRSYENDGFASDHLLDNWVGANRMVYILALPKTDVMFSTGEDAQLMRSFINKFNEFHAKAYRGYMEVLAEFKAFNVKKEFLRSHNIDVDIADEERRIKEKLDGQETFFQSYHDAAKLIKHTFSHAGMLVQTYLDPLVD